MCIRDRFAGPVIFWRPKRRRRAGHEPAPVLENLSSLLACAGGASGSAVSPHPLPHLFRASLVDPARTPRNAGAGRLRSECIRKAGAGGTIAITRQSVVAEPLEVLVGRRQRA